MYTVVLNKNFHSNVNVLGRCYKQFLTSLFRATLFDIFLKPESKQKCLQVEQRTGADPGGGDRSPPKIEKNMIFWRKIVIFHTKYPKIVRASFRSALFL